MSIKFKAGDIIYRSHEKRDSWWNSTCTVNGASPTGAFTVSHSQANCAGFIKLDGMLNEVPSGRVPEFNPESFKLIAKAPPDRSTASASMNIPVSLRLQHSPDCAWLVHAFNKCTCNPPKGSAGSSVTYTGGSSDYYQVTIKNTTTPNRPEYIAECNDIIEALGMDFAEGNAFKALWRRAAQRTLGLRKAGAKDDGLYDAEKVEFFGKRLVAMSKGNE